MFSKPESNFRAWLGFYNRKKEKRRKALEEWRRAVQFHKHKLMVRTFQVWHAWKCERYRSQQGNVKFALNKGKLDFFGCKLHCGSLYSNADLHNRSVVLLVGEISC